MSIHDWTEGQFRHFYFDMDCEDTDSAVLALVSDCLARLGDISGYRVYIRFPLTVERRVIDFWKEGTRACVRYRLAIDLRSRDKNYEYMPVVGFGLAKEEA